MSEILSGWKASFAAQGEVIFYIDELVDVTKLLVGANEFRSGLFKASDMFDLCCEEKKLGGGCDDYCAGQGGSG